MRVDALTEYAIRWIAMRTHQRDERKLNRAISKKSKTLQTTESPIVRFRLKNEIHDMRQELRRKQQQQTINK
jgi:TATA-binding protein-associated factor Taf7